MKKMARVLLVVLIAGVIFFNKEIMGFAKYDRLDQINVGDIIKNGTEIPTSGHDRANYGNFTFYDNNNKNIGEISISVPDSQRPNIIIQNDYSEYWKVTNIKIEEYSYYYGRAGNFKVVYFTLRPYEYKNPEISINCDSETITYGETTECKVNLNYYSQMSSISFKLNTDDYDIDGIEPTDDWKDLEVGEDGTISLNSTENLTLDKNNSTIISFRISPKENTVIDNLDNIQLSNINYSDNIVSNNTISDSNTTVKQKLKEENKEEKTKDGNSKNILKNPSTGLMKFYISIILLFVVVIISAGIITYKKNIKQSK